MQLERNEVLTGVLVIGTIGVIAFLLVLLGAPGLFRPLVTYKVYFDNAAGIKPGAVVCWPVGKLVKSRSCIHHLPLPKKNRRSKPRRRFIPPNLVRAPLQLRDLKRALMCR